MCSSVVVRAKSGGRTYSDRSAITDSTASLRGRRRPIPGAKQGLSLADDFCDPWMVRCDQNGQRPPEPRAEAGESGRNRARGVPDD
jgi:hypothetical protein